MMTGSKCKVCQKELVLDEEYICAHCELKKGKDENITPNINDVNCGICKDIVEEDSEGLFCDVCNTWFHNECNETPLNYELYALLNEAPNNVKWFCDKCIWVTEKWIKSYKVDKRNDGICDEGLDGDDFQTSPEDDDFLEKEVETSIDSQENNASPQENKKIVKRDRPRKVKVNVENYENDFNYDQTNEPEIKIEIQNEENEATDFENNQHSDTDSWVSEEYEEKEKVKKKQKHGFSRTLKRYAKNDWCYCELCTKAFLKPEDLVAHTLWHTGDKRPYKCTDCDKAFAQKGHLKTHSAIHSNDTPFICEICAKRFKLKSALTRHHKEIHTNCDKPHRCSVCEYRTSHKSNLEIHMLKHSNEKPFQCTTCDYVGKTANYLKNHMMVHGSVKPHICKQCGKAFLRKDHLKNHMYIHTGVKPFACTTCDAKFAKKVRLTIHMRIHTGERPFACTLCDYKAVQRNALSYHMNTHSGEKPFVCDICGKQVRDAASLRQHTLIHTGEKPHKCELCGKQFRAAGTLRVHMMYHNKTMKHYCPECGYGAPTRDKIKLHVETVHSSETPYECDMCGNKYKTKGNLSKHKRGVRGSCQGSNGFNLSKNQKPANPHQKEQKPELARLSDQEPEKYRLPFQQFSEQIQIKPKNPKCQVPVQYQNIAVVPTSYQNPPPLHLYTGAPNSNTHYHGDLIPASSIALQETTTHF